jgi:hypothetical protein
MFIVFMGWAPSLCSEFLLYVSYLTRCVRFHVDMRYKMEVQGQNVAWKQKIVTTIVNFLIFPWKYCDIPIKFRLIHSSIENRSVSPATRSVPSPPPIIMSAVTLSLQDRDSEYWLLSDAWNPVWKKSQTIFSIHYIWGRGPPLTTGSSAFRPYLCPFSPYTLNS